MTPSKYQQAIYDWMKTSEGNLIVEAVAGSGKTTTSVEALKLLGIYEVCFVAFNKHIATELQSRVPSNVTACTLNSFGFKVLRANVRGRVNLKADKTQRILQWDVFEFKTATKDKKKEFYNQRHAITKLVSLLKAEAYFDAALDWDVVYALMDKHDIDEPKLAKYIRWQDAMQETWSKCIGATTYIDFDDQIYLPVRNDWEISRFDFCFVDEAQDLNPIQIQLVSKMANQIVAVGDTHQAIYGFRGADPDAMNKIKTRLQCEELPLSICYRCAKNIVKEAQAIVPHIEYHEDAPDGIVERIKDFDSKITDGDYALCRTTAPLIQKCLKMISKGRRATVLGREIGRGLIELVDSLGSSDINTLVQDVDAYRMEQVQKYEAKNLEDKIIMVNDQCDAILALAAEADSLHDLSRVIENLFSDNATDGITFCTIHKSKGLEADRIFILHPELLPHPMAKREWQVEQEMNLKYVAITRAKKELYYVDA